MTASLSKFQRKEKIEGDGQREREGRRKEVGRSRRCFVNYRERRSLMSERYSLRIACRSLLARCCDIRDLSKKQRESADNIVRAAGYPMMNAAINFSMHRARFLRARDALSLYYFIANRMETNPIRQLMFFRMNGPYYHYIILQFMKHLSPGY